MRWRLFPLAFWLAACAALFVFWSLMLPLLVLLLEDTMHAIALMGRWL